MRNLFRWLRKRRFSYEPLVTVLVSRERIIANLDAYSAQVDPWSVAPVLKANAYGHGLVEVARIVDGHPKVPFVVVDSYYEALVLRNERIRSPILVIGHTTSKNVRSSGMRDIAFTISTLHQLREIATGTDETLLVHLKFDTGMHRQGILARDLSAAIEIVRTHPHIHVRGICSHLADADGEDSGPTEKQIALWNTIAQQWRTVFPQTVHYHLSATAGVRFRERIDANVGRLGIGLYGVSDTVLGVLPVLSLQTTITALRDIEAGEHVGYGFSWKANRSTRVATIPVGYYEGVDRRLSNKGFVRVHGVGCPVIGRVSMNMTTVDVTDVPGVKEGDEVEVIGMEPDAQNSVVHMAKLCDTISYDILVHIPTTLRRVVI